ncbi:MULTISPECIES: hypothetical protein [Mycobacteriaceae]|uniref:DUF2933 domain-containing protein n=1 Tax=Mycobacteroides franklinii TaxID=948102 RepID=A0A4R8QY57_9MYCO|nr:MULTISPECIES: hypothetical protein [Mycobacteriaceae]MCV7306165.1 hypothetical protein [Mycobacteroides immunogenum]MDO3014896.1 hypothetical protein [Mycobacteroides abscessus subsp. abscessus]TDZ44530.1 hypothetical protein CCUG64054_04595 [Mycobacteroides franklinii]TDZ47580.1 hypothetical protein CCUG63697_04635 [Mycobacteroides franklinii]TDZ58084.1 hypothetical protein CCUG63696_04591 [Mycobacteroides franklinii]
MTYILTAAAVLVCPLVMGAMMWTMMGGDGAKGAAPSELQALRAELDELRSLRERTQ